MPHKGRKERPEVTRAKELLEKARSGDLAAFKELRCMIIQRVVTLEEIGLTPPDWDEVNQLRQREHNPEATPIGFDRKAVPHH